MANQIFVKLEEKRDRAPAKFAWLLQDGVLLLMSIRDLHFHCFCDDVVTGNGMRKFVLQMEGQAAHIKIALFIVIVRMIVMMIVRPPLPIVSSQT